MSHSDTTPRTFTADRLSAAFNEAGGQARPDYLPDIVAQAGRTRQRPAWTFLERWLPMDIAVRRQGVPRAVLVFAVLALLLTLLVATVAFIGTRPPARPRGRDQRPSCLRQRRRHRRRRTGRNGTADPDHRRDSAAQEGWRTRRTAASRLLVPCLRPAGRRTSSCVDADGSNPVTIASGIRGIDLVYRPGRRTAPRSPTPLRRPGPKGRRVAALQNGDFCTSRIFVAAVDGSGVRQIGDPALDARSPDWSPDGSTIAFGGGGCFAGDRRSPLPDGCRWLRRPAAQ